MEYFEMMKVWLKKPRSDARGYMGKPPISVRWIDVNKGDDLNPEYRSRLVTRESGDSEKSLSSHPRLRSKAYVPFSALQPQICQADRSTCGTRAVKGGRR